MLFFAGLLRFGQLVLKLVEYAGVVEDHCLCQSFGQFCLELQPSIAANQILLLSLFQATYLKLVFIEQFLYVFELKSVQDVGLLVLQGGLLGILYIPTGSLGILQRKERLCPADVSHRVLQRVPCDCFLVHFDCPFVLAHNRTSVALTQVNPIIFLIMPNGLRVKILDLSKITQQGEHKGTPIVAVL